MSNVKCTLPKCTKDVGFYSIGHIRNLTSKHGRFVIESLVDRIIAFIGYAEKQISLVSDESENLKEARAILEDMTK